MIFFVTGVGSGFGLEFGRAAIEAGHIVVGTVRKPADVERTVGPIDVVIANAGTQL